MEVKKVTHKCKKCKTLNTVPIDKLSRNPICGKCKTPLEYPKMPVNATVSTFHEEVDNWPGLLLLDFWALWCGACRMLEPALHNIATTMTGIVKIVKINVDEEPQLARKFGITATPTMVLLKGGKKIDEIVGAPQKEQLEKWLRYYTEQ
ncbi:MAG: thioredoxin [Candidatus Magnetoovum sp. WYHC-5]|nr:thioredoxin [Candidatus Magnetoovum sp. WYHC-5]